GLSDFVNERSVSPGVAPAPPVPTPASTINPTARPAIPRRRGARQRESASLMRIRFSLPLWLLFLYWYPEKRDSTARLRVRLGGAHVRGEGLERGDIAVDVLLLVGYGEGPLLLHPRR